MMPLVDPQPLGPVPQSHVGQHINLRNRVIMRRLRCVPFPALHRDRSGKHLGSRWRLMNIHSDPRLLDVRLDRMQIARGAGELWQNPVSLNIGGHVV